VRYQAAPTTRSTVVYAFDTAVARPVRWMGALPAQKLEGSAGDTVARFGVPYPAVGVVPNRVDSVGLMAVGGKTCLVVDCKRSAKARGLCWRHGGSVICTIEGCTRGAKSRGLCWSHGGGTKCSEPTCDKTMISKGLCWTHGGGKRCLLDGCKRPASEKRQNFCPKHHAQVSQRGRKSP
ncbi:hypothetical protein Poli38472_012502, partial [Pythium oligandrum]